MKMSKKYKIVAAKLPLHYYNKLVQMAKWDDRPLGREATALLKLAVNDYYEESKRWEEDNEEI